MEDKQKVEIAKLLSAGIPIKEIAEAFGVSVSDVSEIQPELNDLNKFRHAQAVYPDLSEQGKQCVIKTHFAEVGRTVSKYIVPRTDLVLAILKGQDRGDVNEKDSKLILDCSVSEMINLASDYVSYQSADIAARRLAPDVAEKLGFQKRNGEELEFERGLPELLEKLRIHERDIIRRLYGLEPHKRRYSSEEVARDFLKPVDVIRGVEAKALDKIRADYKK